MFNLKKSVIITAAGVFFSAVWLWFSYSIQEEQNISKIESIKLRTEVVKNNLEKLYNAPAIKRGEIQRPFIFSLKLDKSSLNLKNFKTESSHSMDLSALKIKSSYKEAGKKRAFFMHNTQKNKGSYFIVRARDQGENVYLDGISSDYLENFLNYDLSDHNWALLNNSYKVILSKDSEILDQQMNLENRNYAKKSFSFNEAPLHLIVDLESPYSNAFISLFGVIGIFMMTFALLYFVKDEPTPHEKKASVPLNNEDFEGQGLTFDEQMDEEIEGLTDNLDDMEMTSIDSVKPLTNEEEVSKPEVQEESPDRTLVSESEDLDYSDFLMENPVLGGADFVEGDEKAQKQSAELKESDQVSNVLPESDKGDSTEATYDTYEASHTDENSTEHQFDENEKVKEKEPEDWLKLAEDLTANIDEFAKSFDKKENASSDYNPHKNSKHQQEV